ncbi:MAG TPA: carbohydrate-binding family 9-like protein [Flavisolibacter sp.]|nr:carbohydrate-binding family 9-like protein [Flavisolibacter sp.]
MSLQVPYIPVNSRHTLREISERLDRLESHAIEQASWPSYGYKPQVSFSIAHNEDAILLKYYVKENSVRICCQTNNGPVHQDSCVEFFISFNNDAGYYNLEFNSIGVCLAAFGKSRSDRKLLPKDSIGRIRSLAQIESVTEDEEKQVCWQLTLMIPMNVFIYHHIFHLRDRKCKVNFYKCGDELPQPHFLSWKPVEADSPDFHLPEYFGKMQFV